MVETFNANLHRASEQRRMRLADQARRRQLARELHAERDANQRRRRLSAARLVSLFL